MDRSRLVGVRVAAGIDQKTMAELTGIPLTTYQRLDGKGNDLDNPPIRYLINCALVLQVEIDEVSPVVLEEWTIFDERAPAPPVGDDHINRSRWD